MKASMPKLYKVRAEHPDNATPLAAVQLLLERRKFGQPRLMLQWWEGGRPRRVYLGTMQTVSPALESPAPARRSKC